MKTKNVLAKILKNIKKKKWNCLVDDCDNFAINSHLIQQNGILNKISNEGHLIEMKINEVFIWNKKELPLVFKKVGVTKALTHKVFCNKHDTDLFKSIENKNSDFKSYKSFLLFSYRAVCAEIRKKLIAIEQHQRILKASALIGKINKDALELTIKGNKTGILDLNTLKNNLLSEINTNNKLYTFHIYEYDFSIEIYASAIFSSTEIKFQTLELDQIYFHILPSENGIIIITGYQDKYASEKTKNYCKSWKDLAKKDLEIKLSTIFIKNIENWGLSVDLFDKIQKKSKKEFIELFINSINDYGIQNSNNFNLFE